MGLQDTVHLLPTSAESGSDDHMLCRSNRDISINSRQVRKVRDAGQQELWYSQPHLGGKHFTLLLHQQLPQLSVPASPTDRTYFSDTQVLVLLQIAGLCDW